MTERLQGASKLAPGQPESPQESPALLISDPALFASGVPHQEFARLRREEPVAWVEEKPLWRHGQHGGMMVRDSGYWAVTRHATVVAVSQDPEVFSSEARGAFLTDPKSRQDLERTRQLMINMDSPRHNQLRRFAAPAFTPRTIGRLQANIRNHARSLVAQVRSRETFDVVHDLAAELPLLVLADLLGMPREDRGLLLQWSNNLVGFDDPDYGGGDIEAYKNTFLEAFAYAVEIAEARRENPRDDLVSELVGREIDGRRLSNSEFCHLWVLLVVAGNETTRHLISGSLQTFFDWPGERDRLVNDPGLLDGAIEELLRWTTPIMQFRRTATEDTELDGQAIRSGDKVVLYYTSANRDEEVFESADRVDLARRPNPHLSFGVGQHFCLGAHLARLEAATLLAELRPHLGALEPVQPAVHLESNFMNGLKSLRVRFTD